MGRSAYEVELQGTEIPFLSSKKQYKSRPIRRQVIVGAIMYQVMLTYGLAVGYTAVLLPKLRANDSNIPMDKEEESWIASAFIGTLPVGCLLSGIAMNLWGLKTVILASLFFLCIGWILMSVTNMVLLITLGKGLTGFAKGLGFAALEILTDEMADNRLRGTIASLEVFGYCVGILMISMLGMYVPWYISAWFCAALSAAYFVLATKLHESPSWLVRNDRIPEAAAVFRWLRGSGDHEVEVEWELQQLVKIVEDERKLSRGTQGNWKFCFKPRYLKPFFIIFIFNIFQIPCGTNLFIIYAVDIISGMKNDSSLDENITNILASATRIVFLIISSFLQVYIGRRVLTLFSGIGSGIAAIILGVVIYFKTSLTWLINLLILLFVAFNTSGFFILPCSLAGEILPSKIRAFSVALVYATNDITLFSVAKCYPYFISKIQIYGLFFIFGISALSCALFLFLFLPETRGLSLYEIEEYFTKSNFLWISRNKCRKYDRKLAEVKQFNFLE